MKNLSDLIDGILWILLVAGSGFACIMLTIALKVYVLTAVVGFAFAFMLFVVFAHLTDKRRG